MSLARRLLGHPLALLASAFTALMCDQGAPGSKPSSDPSTDSAIQHCDDDDDCALRRSECRSSTELAYFTKPRCVAGFCAWQIESTQCPCSFGGCNGSTTTGSLPSNWGGSGGSSPNLCAYPSSVECYCSDGGSGISFCRGEDFRWSPCDCDSSNDAAAPTDAASESADQVECTPEDFSGCQPPASACIDGATLRYYTLDGCSEGRCSWATKELACTCVSGGCQGTGTAGGVGGR